MLGKEIHPSLFVQFYLAHYCNLTKIPQKTNTSSYLKKIGAKMSLFERIRREVPVGLVLHTPVRENPFTVKSIEQDQLVFLVRRTNIRVSKTCWDGLCEFLKKQGGWVTIGAKHEVTENVDDYTLEKYLRKCTSSKSKQSQSTYVAPLLEHLKIAEVKHSRPSQIRLL